MYSIGTDKKYKTLTGAKRQATKLGKDKVYKDGILIAIKKDGKWVDISSDKNADDQPRSLDYETGRFESDAGIAPILVKDGKVVAFYDSTQKKHRQVDDDADDTALRLCEAMREFFFLLGVAERNNQYTASYDEAACLVANQAFDIMEDVISKLLKKHHAAGVTMEAIINEIKGGAFFATIFNLMDQVEGYAEKYGCCGCNQESGDQSEGADEPIELVEEQPEQPEVDETIDFMLTVALIDAHECMKHAAQDEWRERYTIKALPAPQPKHDPIMPPVHILHQYADVNPHHRSVGAAAVAAIMPSAPVYPANQPVDEPPCQTAQLIAAINKKRAELAALEAQLAGAVLSDAKKVYRLPLPKPADKPQRKPREAPRKSAEVIALPQQPAKAKKPAEKIRIDAVLAMDCPAKAELIYKQTSYHETPAMRLGRLVHALILTPDQVMAGPELDKRTKKGKAAWEAAETEAELNGWLICTHKEYEQASAMAQAIQTNERAAKLLRLATAKKQAVSMQRGEMEITLTADLVGEDWVADIVTIPDASDFGVKRAIYNQNLHLKAEALKEATGAQHAYLIFIEKEYPFICRVIQLGDQTEQQARQDLDAKIEMLKLCIKDDDWPSYDDDLAFEI